jgi:hypothetical protein
MQQPQNEWGWCGVMSGIEGAGQITTVLGGAVVLAGTLADGTVVGIPLGVAAQMSGGIGVTLGGTTAAIGWLGQKVGGCSSN